IGHYDICKEMNNLVLQGSLLTLFPPNAKNDEVGTYPTTNDFVKCLQQFIEIGFKLSKSVITDILILYEQHLDKIGDTLLEAFQVVRSQTKFEIVGCCVVEAIKVDRHLEKYPVLDFLKTHIEEPCLEL